MTISESSRKRNSSNNLRQTVSASTPNLASEPINNEISSCPFASEQHDGKELANVDIRLTPEAIYNLIFNDTSFMTEVYNKNKIDDIVFNNWEIDETTGNSVRKITYTASLPSKALGPPVSYLTEIQTASSKNEENVTYVINTEATNAGIMYADAFKIHVHYCITKLQSKDNSVPLSKFCYFASVKFRKNPFFVIKNLIERSSIDGVESTCRDIVSKLKEHADKLHGVISDKVKKKTTKKKKTKTVSSSNPITKTVFKFKWGWMVMLLMSLILLVNGYLYFKIIYLEDVTRSRMLPSNIITEENLSDENLIAKLTKLEKRRQFVSNYIHQWAQEIDAVYRSIDEAEATIQQIKLNLPQYEHDLFEFLKEE